MPEDVLQTERHDRVALIRMNHHKGMNTLDGVLMKAVVETMESFDSDPGVSVIVLTGSDRAFSVGADVRRFHKTDYETITRQDPLSTWDRIVAIRKPIIAAVSGYALGGGCEIALACDMIVASETAIFGQPEVNLGLFPGAGGTQRLARRVGKGLAMEMALNDRRLKAEEALRVGLINHVFPLDTYLEEAIKLGNSIAAKAPRAVREAKAMILAAMELPLTEGMQLERERFYDLFSGVDAGEGVAAFLEKREPTWQEFED